MIALVYNIHQQPLIAWMGTCGTYTPNGHQIRGWNPSPIFLDQWQMCWRWESPADEGWTIHGGTPEIDGLFLKENAMKNKKMDDLGGKNGVALFQGNLHFWRCAIPCPGSAFWCRKTAVFFRPGPPKVRLLDVPPISDPHFCMITEWMDTDLGNVIRSKQELTEAWGIWGISSRKMLEWVEI